jgi:hypothetical protein
LHLAIYTDQMAIIRITGLRTAFAKMQWRPRPPRRRAVGIAMPGRGDPRSRAARTESPAHATRDRIASLNRSALTFTTFLRRLTQTITNVAAIGSPTPSAIEK